MAEKKNNIVDFGLSFLRNLLDTNKSSGQPGTPAQQAPAKTTLEQIKEDDLKREKVRLDQEERKMLADLREIENQKRKMFEEGVRNPNERENRVIARRIKDLDLQATNKDRLLQGISKQMRIINGLIQVKENARMMSESGLYGVLSQIDMGDLIKYIDKASIDGEFNMTKFDEMLNTMEQANAISPQFSEDQDVLDIVAQMEKVRAAGEASPEAITRAMNEMDRKAEAKSRPAETDEGNRYGTLDGG
jgi:hypothetical protein